MRKTILILAFAFNAFAACDLTAPATVRIISSSHWLFDSVEITTYVQNHGPDAATSYNYPGQCEIVDIRIDSMRALKWHSASYLQSGYFLTFKDTVTVLKGPFALTTWVNSLFYFWNEGGGQSVNNVLSWDYNFHPTTIHDTITIVRRDTVRITIRDTVIIRDTLRIVNRDTITIHDTVKTAGIRAGRAKTKTAIQSVLYNVFGQKIWEGNLLAGQVPDCKTARGLTLLLQGTTKRYLRYE